jgi:predicted nucleic acid-binding protein
MRLLDSNILIYAGQPGHAFLDSWMSAATAQVSAISIPEVLGYPGLSTEDEAIFEEWFAELMVHAVTEPILRHAAALRRQRRMKLGDSIIAATALTIGAELVTRNVDDFRHIAGLQIINPFEGR